MYLFLNTFFKTFFLNQRLIKLFGSGHELKFVAGSMAGVTAALATYPLDLVRARLAFNVHTNENKEKFGKNVQNRYRIVRTLSDIVRNEGGFYALYKGLTPTLLAMIPYAGKLFILQSSKGSQ